MPRTHPTLTDQAIRAIAVLTVAGLAALAGWISYRHMLLLAQRAGQTGIDAHAFPLTVDGLDLIGVLVLLADRRTGRTSGWLPWTVLAIGSIASICANVAVAPDNPIARAISGWSAVALLAAAKMLAHLFEPHHGPGTPATAANPRDRPPRATRPTEPDADASTQTANAPTADPSGPRRRGEGGDSARRVPTSDAALTRWRTIWHATRHLDNATADTAAAHGVSLRTLQFVRAAGQHGHLDPPDPQPTVAPPGPQPAAPPGASPVVAPGPQAATGSNHHVPVRDDTR